jgi:hypothetical protein
LQQRGDAAGEQVGVDQMDQLRLRQAERAGDDDRHQHRTRIEGEDVLKPVGDQLADRQHLVDRMNFRQPAESEAGRCLLDRRGAHRPGLLVTLGLQERDWSAISR